MTASETTDSPSRTAPGTPRERNLRQMAALIAEITGLPEEQVVPEADLIEDLYIDSVAKIELMVACENRFGVHIPDEISGELRTVKAVLDHLEESGAAV